jgi:tRNA(Arg) A34 adenosine deaminase TadA
MQNFKAVMERLQRNAPHENIAGYFDATDGYRFKWCKRASASSLPAAAYVLDHLKNAGLSPRKTSIFTTLKSNHWITTYFDNVFTLDQIGSHLQCNNFSHPNQPVQAFFKNDSLEKGGRLELNLIAGSGPATPPLAESLFDAAGNVLDLTNEDQAKLKGSARGLTRSLRYYMLAAYALLGLAKQNGYSGGNYVSAILVGEFGNILSYGVNNGQASASYHHAEVNMLLSYFQRNPTATTVPEKTIVFSTLTPCAQCTSYLQDSRSGNCYIFFGQEDTGSMGNAGKSISDALDAVTKPVRGSQINQGLVNKWAIANGLENCMGKGSVATQIGDEMPGRFLQTALNALQSKTGKKRDDDAEDAVKKAVLTYLNNWVHSVGL